MGRQKSDIVSGGGAMFEIVKALSDSVRNLGGNDDHLRMLTQDARHDRLAATACAETLVLGVMSPVFPLSITTDGLTLAEMIETGRFSLHGTAREHALLREESPYRPTLKAAYVMLDRSATTEEALRILNARGLRPATFMEMVAFCTEYSSVLASTEYTLSNRDGAIKGWSSPLFTMISLGDEVEGEREAFAIWHFAEERPDISTCNAAPDAAHHRKWFLGIVK